MTKTKYARSVHRRCGVEISAPRAKRRFCKTVGKQRFGLFCDKSIAAVTEAIIRQMLRESAQRIKKKPKNDKPPLLRAMHLAKVVSDTNSAVYGMLPKKVAGIYTKTLNSQ